MITLSSGLKNSLIILEILRNDEDFCNKVDLKIGTFTNCRECGLTFMLSGQYDKDKQYKSINKPFTYCVYEHRNSDSIIINGKEGYISLNGDLPYASDSKSTYLASFSYNEYNQAAEKLIQLILERIKE